jgi:hypothetical protein
VEIRPDAGARAFLDDVAGAALVEDALASFGGRLGGGGKGSCGDEEKGEEEGARIEH